MAGKSPSSRSLSFDLVAPFYDLGIWFLALFFGGERRLREKVIEACMPLEGTLTLEIFAGTATLALMASKRGARATALDISAGMLKVAGEKAKKGAERGVADRGAWNGGEKGGEQGVGGGLNLVRGDAVGLPFSTCAFERVIVSMGLHEMAPGEVRSILAECLRVLKGRGRLVILDYHGAGGGMGLLQKLFFLFTEGAEARAWLETDTQGLLTGTGFKNYRRTFLLKGALQLITVEKK